MAPWNGPKPSQPWDVLQADAVLQFYPWRDMVFHAWGEGRLPLWNPYELAGTPLLADSQSAAFYPPHVAAGVLHLPTLPALTILAWFHLFWAGLGAFFLARRFGSSRSGGAIAGASFQLSVFMVAWTGLPSVITTVAWIPWLLGGVKGIFDAGLSRRGRFRSGLLTAFAAGMMLLAGHLQFAAYGLMAASILGLWLALEPGGSRSRKGSLVSFGGALLAIAFGLALAAPQLLPVLRYSQFSHRRTQPTPAGYEAYLGGALRPFELENLTEAYALGSPREPVQAGDQTISAYWPAIEKPGANLAESAVTIGPLILGLLFLAPWRDRRTWPLAAIGLLALLLALGTFLNWPLYHLMPGWSSTGSPGRVIVLFVLAACVLGGLGVCDATGLPPARRVIVLLVPLIGGLACLYAPKPVGSDALAGLAANAAGGALPLALAGGGLAGAGLALLVYESAARYRPALIALPPILAVAGYASNLLMTGRPIPIAPPSGMDRVAYVNDKWSLLVAAPALAPPDTAYLLGTHDVAGYDSLLHRDSVAMLHDADGADPAPPANGNMMFVKPSADPGKLSEAGVSSVLSRSPLPGFGDPVSDPQGLYRYELRGAGRVAGPFGPGRVVSESPSQLVVSATGPGQLVVKDRNMPGWLAKVDGRHVAMSGGLWREVALPPGEHVVEFNYVPPGLMTGLVLGVPAWLALLFVSLGSMGRGVRYSVK